MQIATTTLSSKGQIVIPAQIRNSFQAGEQFLVFQEDDAIVLRKTSSMKEKLKEDLEFERRTRKALEEFDKGNFISMEGEDFLKEMDKW